jgi:HK97 family phage major capsid protein
VSLNKVLIERQLSLAKSQLAAAEVERAALETKQVDMTTRATTATDEQFAAMMAEIDTLKAGVMANRAAMDKLTVDIAGYEKELIAAPAERSAPYNQAAESASVAEATIYPQRTKFFTRETASAVNRPEVKEFLQQFRGIFGSGDIKRESVLGVQNTELVIPDVLLGLLRDRLDEYSKLAGVVNLRRLTGTSRMIITAAPPEAVWTEQCADLNELGFKLYQVELDGFKVGGYIAICDATLQDSEISLADEILYNLGQAIGLALDKAILYGTGEKMPIGIVTRLAQTAKPSGWSAKAPEWTNLRGSNILTEDLAGLEGEAFFARLVLISAKARPNYATGSTFWVMNRATYMEILAKAVVFNAAGSILSSVTPTMPVEGGRIIILPFMQDGDIVGGYGELYILAERHGLIVARSEHVRFLQDQTVFKATQRYDGKPVFGESFIAFNIFNRTPKTEMDFAPDLANEPAGP